MSPAFQLPDRPAPPPAGVEECVAAAAAVANLNTCQFPQQLFVDYTNNGYNMLLIDDPVAAVGVGPGGALGHKHRWR